MIYFHLVVSAALIPILNNFFHILKQPYSWWLVPLLFVGFFAALVLLQLSVLFISILFINVNKPADRCDRYFRFMLNQSLPIILFLARVKVDFRGGEKVKDNKRMLFVCNHQHDFDPVIIMRYFPDHDIGFIGKKEIYEKMPYIAKMMHKLHGLPIDRENDREAAKTIVNAAKLLKSGKVSIGLFPEGYASTTCELLPLRNGSLKVAYRAEAPIVVCVINNTRQLPKRIFRRKTKIDFRVLSVIPYEEYKDLSTIELGNKIHAQMLAALKEIRG